MIIDAEKFLAGSSFSAVKVAGNVTGFADYEVKGEGKLFLIGTDLYLTNADITAVVSPASCTATFADGTTLNSTTSLPTSGNILLVGYTRQDTTRLATGLRNFVAVADTVFTGCSDTNGGALVANDKTTTFAFSGATFHNNNATASGGAFYGPNNYDGERLIFDTNTAATSGGAIDHTAASGELTDVIFRNNKANTGGALYVRGGKLTVTRGQFINNQTTRKDVIGAGAIHLNSGELILNDCRFDSNKIDTTATASQARGGAIYAEAGTLTVTDSVFVDHISNGYGGAINNAATCYIYGGTFSGNYAKTEGGAVSNMNTMTIGASEAGNFTVFANNTGRQALFNNTNKSLTIGNVIFSGNASGAIHNKGSMTVNGVIILETATDTIASGAVTIDCDAFLSDTVKIAKVFDTKAAVTLPSYSLDKTGVAYEITDCKLANDLYIMQSGLELTPIVSADGNICQITIGSKTYYGYGYTDIATAWETADTIVLAGSTHNTSTLTVDKGKEMTLVGKNSLFAGVVNTGTSGAATWGGAVNNYGTVNLSGMTFNSNTAVRGGAVNNNKGAVMTLTDVCFDGNTATANLGSGVHNHEGTVTITNAEFFGSKCCAVYNNGGTMTLRNVYFSGNSDENYGGAIHNGKNLLLTDATFATETDTISNFGTLTFAGNITLNSALGGNGTYVIAKDTVFTNAVDLSAVNISVDGSLYSDKAVTIATGVAAIGNYTTGNDNLFLTVENGNLILREANITGNVTTFNGTGSNLMTNGEVGTFFADKSGADNIATKISGGKVESNLVGGAYAKATEAGFSSATIGKVELLIGGTAEVAAKVYAGGYLYGNDTASAEAQMTVGEVNITIDGGAVSTNMFGGAHAREYGNAKVETVNITVTDGTHSRIYAGGWAEKDAVSSVGTANVTISGGSVDYLYGAGANADGKTYVGTSNITISGDAVVNTIFMGGRYGYSYVNTVNLTFAGENKELTRLSGVSSAGMDHAKDTIVELETNVTADLIDYVDKFIINENCTLTANNEFYLGNRTAEGETAGVTTFDFITDGLDKDWTAIAGIKDFTNAQFSVNGGEAVAWDGESALAIGDYKLSYNKDEKLITLAQA